VGVAAPQPLRGSGPRWKKQFMEKGLEVFGGSEEVKEYEERIGQLERMVGQKEVEIALLKNFFSES